MSNRRKEMWKLLYNLVNRSNTNLLDVFNVIDDILCQEPSLISCASVRELNNKFQDTFVLWLLNKFAKCLSECTDFNKCMKNVQLQQKILTSAWANHPKLFEQLVMAYVDALHQLSSRLGEIDYDEGGGKDCASIVLQLPIFCREISSLREFDAQCTFQIIQLQLENADAYGRHLVSVLQHAHLVGYATHGELFVGSIAKVLMILKECDMDTKLICLSYCQTVLNAQCTRNWLERSGAVVKYANLTLRAMSAMWEMIGIWVAAKCIKPSTVNEFATITEQILVTLESHSLGPESFERICATMREVLILRVDGGKWEADLLAALSRYLQKQLTLSPQKLLPRDLVRLLSRVWRSHPMQIAPLMATVAVKQLEEQPLIIEVFEMGVEKLPEEKEGQQVVAILRALKQMEEMTLLEQQLAMSKGEKLTVELLNRLPQNCDSFQMTVNWNQLAMQLLEQQQSKIRYTKYSLEICSLLLQIAKIRTLLKPPTQQQLLTILTTSEEVTTNQLQLLCGIRLETPSSAHTQLQAFFTQHHQTLLQSKNDELRQFFLHNLPQLFATGYIKAAQLLQAATHLIDNSDSLAVVLNLLVCSQGEIQAFRRNNSVMLYCSSCRPLPATLPGIYLSCSKSINSPCHLNFTTSQLMAIGKLMLFSPGCNFLAHHTDVIGIEPPLCLNLLQQAKSLSTLNEETFKLLVPVLSAKSDEFMRELGEHMLQRIVEQLSLPLAKQMQATQLKLLRLLLACAHPGIDELWLFHWFKMTFYFLLHTNSLVAQQAVLVASQMCAVHNLPTVTLWNWYKRDALGLVIELAMYAYLTEGIRFTRSLRALTKMLGFSCVQEFTCKYHRLLTTMVLPYCVQEPRCKGVIVLLAKQVRKPVAALLTTSFLRLYTQIYLTEPPELGNRCIDLVVSCTQSSLQQLMNADVKQTVAELLIYFNRNPKFVMRSFQCLLQLSSAEDMCSQAANAEFSKFIAERFLGVITYFESCLSEPSFEKPLKEETLYSLGQIMRFVGSQHVTQFRFKIIAMLSFVHTLKEPNLQRICLKIWHIFLHVVNVQELGPSLGRIVATLQPLLAYSVEQVNALYEFVILRNASMLSSYIPDLYFLEHMENVAAPIRQCIARHTLKGAGTLLEQLRFLYKQITNECLQVRIYGLEHLSELFGTQRSNLNQMILYELPMEPLLEQTVNVLMNGCQHDDRQLQLASAKCLGQLGAIDASYLPSNYNFADMQQLPLSVLTDDFAVLALTALCRGYQSQQKSKHVDSFSLAIQETLAVCGISPKENKKVDLWQSMPARMHQVMEPLLHSCYTISQRASNCQQQPIFGSHYTHNSYEEWAFIWVARLVDYIKSSEAHHLLSSYKPCIKRDGNMLSTFYPYILLHALLECTPEQASHIEEEFLVVLHSASGDEATINTTNKLYGQTAAAGGGGGGFKIYESKKYAAAAKTSSSSDHHSSTDDSSSHVPRLASKLCAELLDFLQRWLNEWQRLHGLSVGGKPPETVDSNYCKIHTFINRIDKLLVAHASFNCSEYARALSYLEAYIEEDKQKRLVEQFSFLVELYGRLMDPDSVEGAVQALNYDMSITQEILVNRLVERQQDMITCYEQLLSSNETLQPEHIRAMIDAYLRMDTPKTALLIADGLWQRLADQYTEQYFSECKSELLWRLGSYDELEQLDSTTNRGAGGRSNWHAQCGQACLALRQPATTTSDQFETLLDGMRGTVLEQLRSCSAVEQPSYAHAYDEVLRLHMLHELQHCHQLVERLGELEDSEALKITNDFFADWQSRLQVLQPQVRVLEPIYSFRRNLLAEMQRRLDGRPPLCALLEAELGRLWLSNAQINRNAGQLQRAQLYILKAADYKPSGLFLERAKLMWQKGDQVVAMNYLEEQLTAIKEQCVDRNVKQLVGEQRSLYFEGRYLQATYNAESMHLCEDSVVKCFQEAIAVQRQSERCYVQLAQFQEKMREAGKKTQTTNQTKGPQAAAAAGGGGDENIALLVQIMLNYARSLRYGYDHVYQSMPRLISLWLDTAATCGSNEHVRKMNDLLNNCCSVLPITVFYTAYSQLLSRLCHPSADVYNVLREIIIKLVENYPQQSLWMLLPHFKSSATFRIKRCKLILSDLRLQSTKGFQKLLADFNTLTERLIELTNKEVALDRSYTLSDLDKRLPRLCNQADFSNILLPFEKYMQPTFHISTAESQLNGGNADQASTVTNWFPYAQIYISGFHEKVTILRSAARPKKLTIRCSDGQDYDVMVKPKDDMRKDARLMEFNALVKRYLHQDAQARQRRLHIRTYAVLPFNEECGLCEWLPKLKSFRAICHGFYAQRGKLMGARQLKQLEMPLSEPIEKIRKVFVNILLPAHPPVFQLWFRQQFTTPHSWYEARNSYIRTIAVMSMVGYILGLGDRHGENILFDESSGDAVHVDFNCLFNQGELFAVPEVVPFRLTHNMTTAMGPLGVEGSYRKCCEITLRLLKQETKTLMSVLRPFVYDLGVQNRTAAAVAASSKAGTELTDPKATNDVKRIMERLEGHVKRQQTNSIPLSSEGQVNYLINAATAIDNLAVMYIGWASFL